MRSYTVKATWKVARFCIYSRVCEIPKQPSEAGVASDRISNNDSKKWSFFTISKG